MQNKQWFSFKNKLILNKFKKCKTLCDKMNTGNHKNKHEASVGQFIDSIRMLGVLTSMPE